MDIITNIFTGFFALLTDFMVRFLFFLLIFQTLGFFWFIYVIIRFGLLRRPERKEIHFMPSNVIDLEEKLLRKVTADWAVQARRAPSDKAAGNVLYDLTKQLVDKVTLALLEEYGLVVDPQDIERPTDQELAMDYTSEQRNSFDDSRWEF